MFPNIESSKHFVTRLHMKLLQWNPWFYVLSYDIMILQVPGNQEVLGVQETHPLAFTTSASELFMCFSLLKLQNKFKLCKS